jgi:sortase A
VGAALLVAWSLALGAGLGRQLDAESQWQHITAGHADQRPLVPPPARLARPVGSVDFQLRIPRLGYRAVVHEGVGADVLFGGPGHYPETRWPGQPGNVGVAAHNVYWLRFDELRPGDELALDTRYGTFRYRVHGTQVVGPDDRSVLADRSDRRLTLTTCWPLWAGQFASQRLAIFAV